MDTKVNMLFFFLLLLVQFANLKQILLMNANAEILWLCQWKVWTFESDADANCCEALCTQNASIHVIQFNFFFFTCIACRCLALWWWKIVHAHNSKMDDGREIEIWRWCSQKLRNVRSIKSLADNSATWSFDSSFFYCYFSFAQMKNISTIEKWWKKFGWLRNMNWTVEKCIHFTRYSRARVPEF